MDQSPHITVAVVVEQKGQFLMVREKAADLIVYNQPAGHLQVKESLVAAAERETLEETGWKVSVRHLLGIYHFTSNQDGNCYVRLCFIAEPVCHMPDRELDTGILEALWLTIDQLRTLEQDLRSPCVLQVLEDYQQGIRYPLHLIKNL